MGKLEGLIKKHNPKLFSFFNNYNIEIAHFSFRWIYCLLVREFPLFLSFTLLDHYLLNDDISEDCTTFLCLAILMKYSEIILKKTRDETMIFLHRLPTENWGYQDMENLIEESVVLSKVKF